MGVGLLRRGEDLFLGGIGLAHGNVLPDSARFQPGVLQDHAHAAAQIVPAHMAGIHTIQQDFAPVRVVEPHEKVNKGGFSAACGADNGNALARFYTEIKVLDQGLFRDVGELQIVNLHAAPNRLRPLGVLRLRGALRGFNQFEHPSGTGQRVLQLRHHAGNLVEGLGILIGVV